MKKGHLNLKNIDIDKFLTIKKVIFYVLIFIVNIFTGCDNPQMPIWNTTINFPLVDTQYQFDQMIDNNGENPFIVDSISDIITIIFENDILKKSDSLGVDNNYFLTPEFTLDDIIISQDTNIVIPPIQVVRTIPLNNSVIDLEEFDGLGDICLGSNDIAEILQITNFENEIFEIDDIDTYTSAIFQEYNYVTIDTALMNLSLDDSNFPFPITLDYNILGYVEDTLFTQDSDNLVGSGRVKDQIIFDYIVILEDASEQHEECSALYNQLVCGQSNNLWHKNECFLNLENIPMPDIEDEISCGLVEWNWIDNLCYPSISNENECISSFEGNWIDDQCYISCLESDDCCVLIEGDWNGSECIPAIDGWTYNSINNYDINVSIDFDIQSIENISGTTKPLEFSDLISTPLINNSINILGGDVSSEVEHPDLGDINSLKFNIENNYIIPLGISIDLLNFIIDSITISITDTINAGLELNVDKKLNSSEIIYYSEIEEGEDIQPIDSIFMNVNLECMATSGLFNYDSLSNISINISNILIEPIEFDLLRAVIDTIALETPSLVIDNIPSGFQGVLFADPSLIINIFNEISINNTLNLNIEAVDDEVESESLNINANINYPEGEEEIANTCIKLDANTTYVYNGECDLFPIDCNIENNCTENYNEDFSLDDLLENSPNSLNVSGEALINGEGTLLPNKYVWGDFRLEAPFSLILGDTSMINFNQDTLFQNLNIIPAQSSILQSIDEETKENIDNSLLSASIISEVTNHTPIAGNLSLIISNNDSFFPLFIDSLIIISAVNNPSPVGKYSRLIIWPDVSPPIIDPVDCIIL